MDITTQTSGYECVFWREDGANGVLGFSPRVDSCDEIVTNDDDTPHETLALLVELDFWSTWFLKGVCYSALPLTMA
jgi:hypothetical protein